MSPLDEKTVYGVVRRSIRPTTIEYDNIIIPSVLYVFVLLGCDQNCKCSRYPTLLRFHLSCSTRFHLQGYLSASWSLVSGVRCILNFDLHRSTFLPWIPITVTHFQSLRITITDHHTCKSSRAYRPSIVHVRALRVSQSYQPGTVCLGDQAEFLRQITPFDPPATLLCGQPSTTLLS